MGSGGDMRLSPVTFFISFHYYIKSSFTHDTILYETTDACTDKYLSQQDCHLIESMSLGISNDTKHHASHAYQVTSHGHREPKALAPNERHRPRWNSREKVPEHP